MLAGLRQVLGYPRASSWLSNITGERLRYDITHPETISDSRTDLAQGGRRT
jgi:hypothetical protein